MIDIVLFLWIVFVVLVAVGLGYLVQKYVEEDK